MSSCDWNGIQQGLLGGAEPFPNIMIPTVPRVSWFGETIRGNNHLIQGCLFERNAIAFAIGGFWSVKEPYGRKVLSNCSFPCSWKGLMIERFLFPNTQYTVSSDFAPGCTRLCIRSRPRTHRACRPGMGLSGGQPSVGAAVGALVGDPW